VKEIEKLEGTNLGQLLQYIFSLHAQKVQPFGISGVGHAPLTIKLQLASIQKMNNAAVWPDEEEASFVVVIVNIFRIMMLTGKIVCFLLAGINRKNHIFNNILSQAMLKGRMYCHAFVQ
jgi:hypothetical protein